VETSASLRRAFDELSRVAQSSRSVESLSRVAQSSRSVEPGPSVRTLQGGGIRAGGCVIKHLRDFAGLCSRSRDNVVYCMNPKLEIRVQTEQHPISNIQAPEKVQLAMTNNQKKIPDVPSRFFRLWNLNILWCLVFGVWSFLSRTCFGPRANPVQTRLLTGFARLYPGLAGFGRVKFQ